MIYNNTLHQSIGMSPSSYLMGVGHAGVDLPAVSEEARQLWSAGHPKFNPYCVGQSVVRKLPCQGHLTISKFMPKYDGPYIVDRVNPNQLTYTIKHRESEKCIRLHHKQVSPWVDPPEYLAPYYQEALNLLYSSESDLGGAAAADLMASIVVSDDEEYYAKSSGSKTLQGHSQCGKPNSSRPGSKEPSEPAQLPGSPSGKKAPDLILWEEPVLSVPGGVTPNVSPVGPACSNGEEAPEELTMMTTVSENNSTVKSREEEQSSGFSGFSPVPPRPIPLNEIPEWRRRHSSVDQHDSLQSGELMLSNEGNTVLDWELEPDPVAETLPSSITTPSSGEIHDHIVEGQRRAEDWGDMLREFEDEDSQSGRPPRTVSKQTPIISQDVLSRMRTRASGPVKDYPNVMKRPLEFRSAQHRNNLS